MLPSREPAIAARRRPPPTPPAAAQPAPRVHPLRSSRHVSASAERAPPLLLRARAFIRFALAAQRRWAPPRRRNRRRTARSARSAASSRAPPPPTGEAATHRERPGPIWTAPRSVRRNEKNHKKRRSKRGVAGASHHSRHGGAAPPLSVCLRRAECGTRMLERHSASRHTSKLSPLFAAPPSHTPLRAPDSCAV